MRKHYYIRKILDYLGVTALLSVLIFLWVLYQGPISVPFLKPYIIKALNTEQSEYSIDIGEVNIELVRSLQPIKIIAKNVVLKKNDDTLSVKTKKLFLSFSIRALLQGLIAPSSILIKNPEVAVFTTYGVEQDKKNEINRKKFEYYVDWFNGFLERFHAEDKIYIESFINDITIQNASIEFHEVDLGKKWQFTNANLSFDRALTNFKLSASGVVDLEERMATLGATAKYDFITRNINLGVKFSDVVISDFISDIGGGISSIDIPVEGDLNAEVDFAKIIENPEDLTANIDSAFKKIDFSVKTSGGTIVFEDNHYFDYPIDALDFKGEVKGGLDEIRLKKAVLQMQDQTVQLGVAVTGYQKYFFEKSLDDLKLSLNAKTKELSMNDLAKFWPKYYSEPAWRWCKDNLYGGTYQDADFHFEWAYDQNLKSVELKKLEGVAHITGGTIWYMEEMPKVTDVDGTAKFDIGIIDIAVEKGMSDGLKIDKGHVKLYDLAEEHNFIDISIQGQTSIKQALEYINHPPLEFAKDLGIDPQKVQGRVDIDLNLNFELYEDLKSEDIKVKTTAVLHDVIVKNVFEGKDLSASRADLKVTENGLNAKGHALFGTIPVQFDYGIDFSKKDTESKGHFALTYDNQTGEKLGLKETLLQEPYMEGYAFVNADITTKNNVSEMDIKADLTHMALDYSFFGLVKPVDQAGSIHTKLVIKDGHLTRVPLFELKSDDFSMKGDISLDNRSRVQTINISNIEGNKTSAAAKIEYSNTKQQHVKINISGSSYNLESLFDSRDEDQKKKPKTEALSNDDDGLETWPDTDVFIAVSSLWTNPDTPIKNFAGSATIKNGIGFDEVHMVGNLGADKSIKFNLDYTPHINQEHRLMIESNNAGSTLKVLRLYENMSGGNLKIEAKREPNKKFIGHAQIRDFKIYNTPLLTKLLTVASFSGMLDLLKGDGLVFSHFDAPFTYAGKVLTINDAKMFGNVIGLTATGSVNRINEDINIQGVVSPAYGLNSLMGKIPLIGKFLAGKDGTVFAVDYTITDTISAPNVEIYPLSLLSPNSVKELFADESGQ